MDRLSERAMEARKRKMSYGKYIAMLEQQKQKEEQEKEAKRRKCVLCGLLVPPGKGNRRYCSAECAEKYREQEAQKRREAEKK